MKFLKCLASILALLLLLTLIAACGEDLPPPEGDTEQEETESTEVGTQGAQGEQVLLADSTFAARIVYSADDASLSMSAQTIASLIKKRTGVAPSVEMDVLTSYDEHDIETVEILLGNTSYPESRKILETVGYGEWGAAMIGNKLVINAHTVAGSKAGATGFLNHIVTEYPAEEPVMALPVDFRLTAVSDAIANRIPLVGAGELKCIYDSGDLTRTVSVKKLTQSDYTEYLHGIEDKGYSKYSENQIGKNLFATYTDQDGYALTVAYSADNRTLTAIVDRMEGRVLPGKEEDNVYDKTKKYETILTQVGLCYDLPEGVSPDTPEGGEGPDYTGGLLHIYRLEDGSFLIIDSGHDRDSLGDLIYDFLRKQAPDPDNIVIAAWIISHTHSDHVGGLINFAARYGSRVTVEQFIFNFPGKGSEGMTSQTQKAMDYHFPDAKQIKTHAGDVFYVRNARIDVLYSFELIAPYDMSWYNECSLAFTVSAEGQRIMYLTDVGPLAIDRLCDMYGEAMACDFVQVAHHGWNGTNRLYELIDPDYVLFNGTTGPQDKNGNDYFFKKIVTNGVVSYEKQEWITEIYRAVEGIQIFTLESDAPIRTVSYETHEEYLNAT